MKPRNFIFAISAALLSASSHASDVPQWLKNSGTNTPLVVVQASSASNTQPFCAGGTGAPDIEGYQRVETSSTTCWVPESLYYQRIVKLCTDLSSSDFVGTECEVEDGSYGFYAGQVGGNYIVFSNKDEGSMAWANNSGTTAYGVNTGATSTSDGQTNTNTLVLNYSDVNAAQACASKGDGNWYLPAKDELNLLWQNSGAIGLNDQNINTSGTYYWSSTEYSSGYAWIQRFSDGNQDSDHKNTIGLVRCARSY